MNPFSLTEQEGQRLLEESGAADLLSRGSEQEIPPKWDDLGRLYTLVRSRKPFQILEFGSGFSTIVMAFALKQNWAEYVALVGEGVRRYEQPGIVSVESSREWCQNTRAKVREARLQDISEIVFSRVSIAEHEGEVCHFYEMLPDVVPDFVYLDGPDPATVEGSVKGISFQNPRRTVMSGDILKYESTLLPGFFMIVDGRTNNARFLERLLKRSFDVQYHEGGDVTTFELMEPRLGRKNIYGYEAYTGKTVTFAGTKVG